MAPDRTILHLVESNYGVHIIKPQLRPWQYWKQFIIYIIIMSTGGKYFFSIYFPKCISEIIDQFLSYYNFCMLFYNHSAQ